MNDVARPVGRNDPCPCGSGKRYKHCCGSVAAAAAPAAAAPAAAAGTPHDPRRLMQEALAAQQARRLAEAERLYRDALQMLPDQPDALHMLGVVRYELGDDDEAQSLILRALDQTGWRIASMRHNLGLVLAHRAKLDLSHAGRSSRSAAYRQRSADRPGPQAPLVSVLVPVYNHERYVVQALESVYAQTYRNIELIVIDDGSTDASAELARQTLERCPFPARFITRANRGAAATLNEALALARGQYVNPLNSDDWFHPERIATMVEQVVVPGHAWGFSGVTCVDTQGAPLDPLRHAKTYALTCAFWGSELEDTLGYALLTHNIAVSTGNLLFARELGAALDGFHDLRYNHDWDFCLRALRLAEPAAVRRDLYFYRLHETNTIAEAGGASARAEARAVLAAYLAACAGAQAPPNVWAPCRAHWGRDFTVQAMQGGLGELIDPALLRAMVMDGGV